MQTERALSMKKRHKKSAVFALLLSMAVTAPASAAYIVDTGTPSNNNPWLFSLTQHFAGQFSVGTDTTVTGVEGWFFFEPSVQGSLTISLHGNSDHLPGAILYSASLDILTNSFDWYGLASGLNWAVPAGTYWVSFRPGNGLFGVMPGTAPSPLPEYAVGIGNGWYNFNPNELDFLALGVRISGQGTVTDVPEPAALGLATLGLVGLGILGPNAARRRRHS